jgi:hypothetical protein
MIARIFDFAEFRSLNFFYPSTSKRSHHILVRTGGAIAVSFVSPPPLKTPFGAVKRTVGDSTTTIRFVFV